MRVKEAVDALERVKNALQFLGDPRNDLRTRNDCALELRARLAELGPELERMKQRCGEKDPDRAVYGPVMIEKVRPAALAGAASVDVHGCRCCNCTMSLLRLNQGRTVRLRKFWQSMSARRLACLRQVARSQKWIWLRSLVGARHRLSARCPWASPPLLPVLLHCRPRLRLRLRLRLQLQLRRRLRLYQLSPPPQPLHLPAPSLLLPPPRRGQPALRLPSPRLQQ